MAIAAAYRRKSDFTPLSAVSPHPNGQSFDELLIQPGPPSGHALAAAAMLKPVDFTDISEESTGFNLTEKAVSELA